MAMLLVFVCISEYSNNVWIDHVDVSSDRDHDKDYYDGLIDVNAPLIPLVVI
jgi:pectate lyase